MDSGFSRKHPIEIGGQKGYGFKTPQSPQEYREAAGLAVPVPHSGLFRGKAVGGFPSLGTLNE